MSDATYLTPEFSGRLCLTLLHSLWQMGLLAVVGWAVERWRGRRSLEWAYGVHVALLASGVVATATTFARVDCELPQHAAGIVADAAHESSTNEDGDALVQGQRSAAASRLSGLADASPMVVSNRELAATRSGALGGASSRDDQSRPTAPAWLRFAPFAAACYAVGVLAMLARLAMALGRVQRLRRRAVLIGDGRLLAMRDALAQGWSMRVTPALASARDVVVPMVVGFVRPTVLLPLAAVNNLTLDELELILAHELAHVRRHDVWVNLFQRLVETALFFNPGAWRLSRRISALREYCCDEAAAHELSQSADRAASVRTRYARALVRIAEMHYRHAGGVAALAATGRAPSELRRRIARLFGEPLREPLPVSRSGAALVAVVMVLLATGPALRPHAAEPQSGFKLQFPADRAVGVVYTRPASAGGFGWDQDHYTGWERVGEAQGPIALPGGAQVRFDLAKSASTDLSFLAELPPGAIQMMRLEGTDIADDNLRDIGRLTGLQWLSLEQTRVTDAGIQHLAELKRLKHLSLDAWEVHKDGFGVGDDALGVLAFLPELEQISLRLTKVTDEGMARLAVIKSLKCVSIPGTKVTDAGLAHLARLPRLEYLRLGVYDEGIEVTDEGMRIVGQMKGLRYLDLSATKVSDEGLKHLSSLTRLESLCIEETDITNDGLGLLAPLTSLKTLRAYQLGDGEIRDHGAAHLAKLPRLETIQSNMQLTNKGVIAIAKAPQLKALSLSDPQITDECCAALATMPNLTELWFQDCQITDAGLEQISRSQSLEYLLINDAPITSEGLRHLKNLPKLVRLSIDMDVQEDRSPDEHPSLRRVGELTGLTDLDVDGFAGSEIEWLAPLNNLTALELGWKNPIDDEGCAVIGGMSKLERLTIHASVATDAGLASLGKLKALKYLSVSCLATDNGLAALEGLKSLWRTQIASPHVTQAGLDRLAMRLPSLQDISKYVYRLDNTDVTPSTKDEFFRRGAPEARAERDALEDCPPPPLNVEWRFNAGEGDNSRELTLADLRGNVVLVHFWGARISNSQRVQPEIQALYEKYADQGFEIVGVHMTDHAESLDAFVEQHKVAWPVCLDLKDQTNKDWNVDVVGEYLIDRSGTLRMADIFRPHLDSAIEALLAEPAPPGDDAPPSPQVAEEAAGNLSHDDAESEDPAQDGAHASKFSIEVRPTTPDGRPAHDVYLTLWRELAEGEPVTGDEFVWHEIDTGSLWDRARTAHPNDGRHSRDPSVVTFRFDDLPPGRYRVTAMNYDPDSRVPDPTPYGVSRAVLLGLGENAATKQAVVDVALGGSRALTVEVLDEQTKKPIEGIGLRLRDAHGMPIVHGRGSGNFFERTGENGTVVYGRLNPGEYTVDILGRQPQVNEFIEYKPMINMVRINLQQEEPSKITINPPRRRLTDEEIAKQFPFAVFGRVTDDKGQPMADVEVRAATGIGTLLGGGRVTTDADGRYRLYFSAGMGMQRSKFAPLGVGIQAASFFASKDGWYETNLCRQGDLQMTDAEGITGDASKFVFPNKPREVVFTMARAAVLEGKLVANGSRGPEDVQLTLDGAELPPSSSVLDQLKTGDDGEFRFDCVPLGKKWRISMRVGPTWDEIETEPFELTRPGVTRCEVSLNSQRTAAGAVTVSLAVRLLDGDAAER